MIENADDARALTAAAVLAFEKETIPSFIEEVLHQIELVAMDDRQNKREYDVKATLGNFPQEAIEPMKAAITERGFTITGTVISW